MFARRITFLAVACLGASCGQSDLGFSIPFTATWNGTPIDCGSSSPAMTDLRFYVSDVQLIDSAGEAWDIRFATEMPWQNDAVALIDLEDGTGACTDGTPELTAELIMVAPPRDYRGLRFTVGVPFRLNHLDPSNAGPPLGNKAMHRDLRSGYTFLRAGVRTEYDGFWIHLGSAGCEGTVGNITGCRFPNRAEVNLPGFEPGESSVAIDLAALLSGTNLDDHVESDCSSGRAETACVAPFAALGIDFESGQQQGGQRVFSTH